MCWLIQSTMDSQWQVWELTPHFMSHSVATVDRLWFCAIDLALGILLTIQFQIQDCENNKQKGNNKTTCIIV